MKFMVMVAFLAVMIFGGVSLCHCLSLVKIDSINGHDNASCLTGTGLSSCQSLEYIAINMNSKQVINGGNDLMVLIISQELILREVVSLSQLNNFTLQGTNQTVITCGANSTGRAGIQFINSSNVNLLDFTIENCSCRVKVQSRDLNQWVGYSMLIRNCLNINMINVTVQFSHGILFDNNKGKVSVNNCLIEQNRQFITTNQSATTIIASSGIMMIITGQHDKTRTMETNYRINKVKFVQNKLESQTKFGNVIQGGALTIWLLKGSEGNRIEIEDNQFINNSADFGGGLYLKCESCGNNTLTLINNSFENNLVRQGGGAIYIELSGNNTCSNNISFTNCNISDNEGDYGGGVAILTSSLRCNGHLNQLMYDSCKFFRNQAFSGAAIDAHTKQHNGINEAFEIHVKNCLFSKNVACESTGTITNRSRTGIFVTFQICIYFTDFIRFENNQGTALYLINAFIVTKDANVFFTNNIGDYGGGILLMGEGAFMESRGNNYFSFDRNRAFYGGGISSIALGSVGSFPYRSASTCFIQKQSEYYNFSDLFEFKNNYAVASVAKDIFVSTLNPCLYMYNCTCVGQRKYFFEGLENGTCLGNMMFNSSDDSLSYATSTARINVSHNVIEAFPGIDKKINVTQQDQLGQDVDALFPISISLKENTSIAIKDSTNLNTGILIQFKGLPGPDSTTLIIQSNTISILKTSVGVRLVDCPPGLYFNHQDQVCECSTEYLYRIKCNPGSRYSVKLKESSWAGYLNSNKSSDLFATAACLKNFCEIQGEPNFQFYNMHWDKSKLEQFVCGKHRQGILCSKCISGYTSYFNSPSFKCGKETLCSYGIPFFILVELVPVTVIFLSVIAFDIHLTSGSLYSFIFYSQTLNFFYIDVFDSIKFNNPFIEHLIEAYRIIYGSFNLRFLYTNSLSFCVFRNMNMMDLFVLQYATMGYVFLLIFITVLFMKINTLYSCIKFCHKLGRRDVRSSIINALTAVVVLYYFKSVHLTSSTLQSVNVYVQGKINRTVALFNGEVEYLKGTHLWYAIPAFICLLVVIFIPLALLVAETILTSILKYFKNDNKFLVYMMLQLKAKFKPLVKSLQGCFRENHRCFAGCFFTYRILLMMPKLVTAKVSVIYVSAEITVFMILIIHYTFQPFRKQWHNKLDVLLLANFLIVNMITIHNYYTRNVHTPDTYVKSILVVVQVTMMSIPLLYVLVLGVHHIAVQVQIKIRLKNVLRRRLWISDNSNELTESLPARLLLNDSCSYTADDKRLVYNTFEEK